MSCKTFQKKALCPVCGSWFKNRCAVRRHQRRQHNAAVGAMLKSVAAILPQRCAAAARAPEASEATTANPTPPPSSEELTCADHEAEELLAEFGWERVQSAALLTTLCLRHPHHLHCHQGVVGGSADSPHQTPHRSPVPAGCSRRLC